MDNSLSDQELEKKERDSFILLQHIYTASEGDPDRRFHALRLGEALGFAEGETLPLLDHLCRVRYLEWHGAGTLVSITPSGLDYIEKLAWRRRTVRLVLTEP